MLRLQVLNDKFGSEEPSWEGVSPLPIGPILELEVDHTAVSSDVHPADIRGRNIIDEFKTKCVAKTIRVIFGLLNIPKLSWRDRIL